MRLRDVEGVAQILAGSPLTQDSLWDRELVRLSENDITLFYARAGIQMRRHAIELVERVQSAAIVAAYRGNREAGISAIISHTPPPDPFLVDELISGLAKLPPVRRRACLYALTMGMTPEAVSALTWETLPQQLTNMPALAQEILAECDKTRHIRLPYVFWEWATPRIAAPVLQLQASIEDAFGFSWPELVEKHRRMLMLNRGAESASFLQLAEEVRRGRL